MDKPFSDAKITREKRKVWLKTLSVTVIVLAGFSLLMSNLAKSVDRDDIRIAKVTRGDIQTGIAASGVLLPQFEETVASHIDSHLKKTFVQNGQKVTAGQPLLQLDTTKLQLALEKDNESIALKDNQIEMLGHDLTQSVNDLNGKVALLNIDLESRQTRHARLAKLAGVGGASAHDIKEAELDIKRTQIEIEQLGEKINNLKASTKTKIEGLKLEKSMVERSRNETRRLMTKANVTAPLDGVVTGLVSEEGSAVTTGQVLVKIADTSGFKVSAGISDFYANQLFQGMSAQFEYDGQQYFGEIETIVAKDTEGGLQLQIKLQAGQSTARLRQRLRVELNLITNQFEDTLMLAKGPFIRGSGIVQVFVLAGGEAVRREVRVGPSNRDFYQIQSGLKVGDQVIISDVSDFASLNQIKIN